MKNKLVTSVLFVGLVLPVIAQKQITSADVMDVISCIKSHACKNAILTESFGSFGEQVVFVKNNKRYTIYWSGEDRPKGFLSVWVRPDGTSDQASLATFTDHGLDGSVDFGLQGPASWTDSRRKLFRSENDPGGQTNLQFRQYWQSQFDEATTAALHRLFNE